MDVFSFFIFQISVCQSTCWIDVNSSMQSLAWDSTPGTRARYGCAWAEKPRCSQCACHAADVLHILLCYFFLLRLLSSLRLESRSKLTLTCTMPFSKMSDSTSMAHSSLSHNACHVDGEFSCNSSPRISLWKYLILIDKFDILATEFHLDHALQQGFLLADEED